MATIRINTNLGEVSKKIAAKLAKLKDKDYLLRPVCFDLIEIMKLRIHERGQDKNNSAIGAYSNAYLRIRQKKYQRSADTKVIVSLTRQLENDWSVVATTKGYGVGFKNKLNLQKAEWVEAVKKKEIFSLSKQEVKYATDFINDLVREALSGD